MRLALIHDDLIQFGGAEKLVLAMHEVWPEAPLYTAVASPQWLRRAEEVGLEIRASFLQKLPWPVQLNRFYAAAFLHPLAFKSFDLSEFDVVVSSSARFAHGVFTRPDAVHICYMNTPPRMVWEPEAYFGKERFGGVLQTILAPVLVAYRKWDRVAATRPDYFVANSENVRQRIAKYYGREAEVIYPFSELGQELSSKNFPELSSSQLPPGPCRHPEHLELNSGLCPEINSGYWLVVTRLVPWKRVDLAVEVFARLKVPLVVVGEGPDRKRLEKLARAVSTSRVTFVGRISDQQLLDYYRNCRALIVTQEEDFGIASLEAMVCGKPVLAFGRGGVGETVVAGKTGEFFEEQTRECLARAVAQFDPTRYSKSACQEQARRFSKKRFQEKLREFVRVCPTNPSSV